MSLEDVKDEIIRKAEKEAEKQRKEAEKESLTIVEEAQKKAQDTITYHKEKIKNENEMMQNKTEASNDLELKKALLTEKKKIIDEVIEQAIEKIVHLSKEERKKFLKKLVEEAKLDIKVQNIFCNKNDKDLIEGNVKEAKIKGGIIAENGDGSVSVDLSVEMLLEDYKEKNIEKISNILFK